MIAQWLNPLVEWSGLGVTALIALAILIVVLIKGVIS